MKKIILFLILFLGVGFVLGEGNYKPTVTTKKCTGCNECVGACPVKAITKIADKAIIDPEKCIGCMVCVQTCSWGAVE